MEKLQLMKFKEVIVKAKAVLEMDGSTLPVAPSSPNLIPIITLEGGSHGEVEP